MFCRAYHPAYIHYRKILLDRLVFLLSKTVDKQKKQRKIAQAQYFYLKGENTFTYTSASFVHACIQIKHPHKP